MARLWRDRGKQDDACELRVPVSGWFTEGFDTSDLGEVLLPIQHVRYEVGSLSETGPLVLDTRLSHLDPKPTSALAGGAV